MFKLTIKNVQIRMENELKERSDELFNNLGTSTNEAIKIFLSTAVRTNGFPFEITLDKPNTETKKAIEEAYAIQDGKIETQVYDTVDDFMKDLRS